MILCVYCNQEVEDNWIERFMLTKIDESKEIGHFHKECHLKNDGDSS